MARPRTPLGKLKATGADVKNPQRFRDRKEPKVTKLGAPPDHLSPEVRAEWEKLAAEIPWLGESDRTIVEAAATLRALLTAGELEPKFFGELRQTLNALGATPSSRTKVSAPDSGDDDEDPAAEFLN